MSLKNLTNLPKRLDKAVKKASVQALNRAATSTRAKFAKEASKELGLPSGKVKIRTKVIKAKSNSLAAIVSIGTRIKMAAHLFKPKNIKVNTRLGPRNMATFQVKGGSRHRLPGSFGVRNKVNNKYVVIERTSEFSYPTKTTTVGIFLETAKAHVNGLKKHFSERFKKEFDSLIKLYTFRNKK